MIDQTVTTRQEARLDETDDRRALGLLLDFIAAEADRLGLDEVSRLTLLASRQCLKVPAPH